MADDDVDKMADDDVNKMADDDVNIMADAPAAAGQQTPRDVLRHATAVDRDTI
jgi:hypothetical protein